MKDPCRFAVLGAAIAMALATPHAALANTIVTTTRYTFQPNIRLTNPVNPTGLFLNQDVEPSIKVDTDGDVYIGAIRGVPGGVDIWKAGPAQFAAQSLVPAFLGQPDNLCPNGVCSPFAPGGGDIDIAVGLPYPNFPTNLGPGQGAPTGNLYSASLYLANITLSLSKSQGSNGSWFADYFATQTNVDDRQWLAGDGSDNLYMLYSAVPGSPLGTLMTAVSSLHGSVNMHDTGSFADSATQMQGGAPISTLAFISGQHHGNVVIDHNPDPVTHQPTLYMPFATVDNLVDAQKNAVSLVVPFHTLYVAIGTPVVVGGMVASVNWHDVIAFNAPKTDGVDHIFPSMAVDLVGNVYVMFAFQGHLYYMVSKDHGQTWNASTGGVPTQIDSPLISKYNLFPWLDAGSHGRVDFTWYGTNTTADPNNATDQWKVFFAQTNTALSSNPTIYEQIASDHIIHTMGVCQLGLGCNTGSGNRNLADLFQIAVDQFGMANIAYTDDHIKVDSHGNAIPPQTYYTKQTAGPSAKEIANLGTATQLSGGGPVNTFPNPTVSIGRFSLELGFPAHSTVPTGGLSIYIPSLGLNFASTRIASLAISGPQATFSGTSNLGAFTATAVGANPDDIHLAALAIRLASTGKSINLVLPRGAIEAYNAW